jgi:hypothetical protein
MPPRLSSRHRRALVLGVLLSGLVALLGWPAPAGAEEVWAESMLDRASALRDASEKVPAGARILSSRCSEVALRGLSFRYRCNVRFERAPSSPASAPLTTPAPGAANP